MPFTPNTAVYLCNVPLEMDQKNQLDFADATAQHLYFSNNIKKSYSSFTYQRKDNVLRVPECIDDLWNCNYVMYQNSNFCSKWFYCFIDHMEYVNPNCTALYLKTDVFQTWIFDATLLSSFVAREHVADDTVFLHTLPEPTPAIEMQAIQLKAKYWHSQTPAEFTNDFYVAAYATGTGITPDTTVDYCGNVPTPGYLFVTLSNNADLLFDTLIQNNYSIDFTTALPKDAVGTIATNVTGIYVAMDKTESSSWGGDEQITLDSIAVTSVSYGSGNTYTIRNNKINCYPYMYIEMHDLCGQSVILKPEDMNALTFYWHAESGATPSYTLYYPSYENEVSFKNSISINAFPAIPYAVDYYTQYLALHKNSVEFEKFEMNYNSAKSLIFSGGEFAADETLSGATTIIDDQMRRLKRNAMYSDLKARPPITHNPPTGNAKFGMNALGMHINRWIPKKEYIQILDDWFDFYGYNVSTVKIPQYKSRPSWNYIETVNINIEGNVPQDDMQELKNIFNSGVTIWHDPAQFGDYSQNNAPT